MRKTTVLLGIMAVTMAVLASHPAASVAAQERAGGTLPAKAQEQVLYSFMNASGTGSLPEAGLISDAAGNLYGTTVAGGSRGGGVAFELSPQSGGEWTETVLHNFHSNSQDGRQPAAGLIFDGVGNLYGTTSAGGANGLGSVFELSPHSGGVWTEEVLYSFKQNGQDGNHPGASLIFDVAGNLYGITGSGGTTGSLGCYTHGCGIVFELSPQSGSSWIETVLYSFLGGADGGTPMAGVIRDVAGNLYGTTSAGGSDTCEFGCGTIFELSPQSGGGWSETTLHSFQSNGQDGYYSYASLVVGAAGNLYGTTLAGGSGGGGCGLSVSCGTVFQLSPKLSGGWSETVIHSFQDDGTDGLEPASGLVLDKAGNLYGTTNIGGSSVCFGYGCGTVFELSPQSGGTWSETVLHDFKLRGDDGYSPFAGLIFDGASKLYGTTEAGGTGKCGTGGTCGTVFEVTP